MNSATETAIPLGSSPLTDLFALLASVGRAARQETTDAGGALASDARAAGNEQVIGSPATAGLEEEKEEEKG